MVLTLLVTVILGNAVFWTGELIRRRLGLDNEISRKLLHAIFGVCIGVWPIFVGYEIVYVTVFLSLITVMIFNKLHWLPWLWSVGRKSWGEYFYFVGIIGAALLAQSPWIYLAGVLQLALADAAAALFGKKFGGTTSYNVLGQQKSVVGTAAFLVVSALVFGAILRFAPVDFVITGWQTTIALAVVVAFVENTGVYGLDNLFLPIASVILLNALL